MKRLYGLVLLLIIVALISCKSTNTSDDVIVQKENELALPAHFPIPQYEFGDNVYSDIGFELGKKLFYDPALSVTNDISCASCHKQEDAFADRDRRQSFGIFGRQAIRNTPTVTNLIWSTSFMWDGGVNHIEVSPLGAIQNELEMGENVNSIVAKLKKSDDYQRMFKEAFNRDSITVQQFFWALTQYMSTLISATSKYDEYVQSKTALSANEQEGLMLFREHCESCHKEPLFTDYSFQNNGIDSVFTDSGRAKITNDINDMGKFKVPSLRNVQLTAPYMHDGRFETLEGVLDHYADHIKQSATLSNEFKLKSSNGLALLKDEQQQIISFLNTLTDHELIANTKFSKP